ncbi:hypothetical protein D3C86_1732120 [compost metagenome]
MSISVRWLKTLSAKGVENDTAMLTIAVSAITVEYSPRSNPIVSISNTGETFTKVRMTATLIVVTSRRLMKKRLSSVSAGWIVAECPE